MRGLPACCVIALLWGCQGAADRPSLPASTPVPQEQAPPSASPEAERDATDPAADRTRDPAPEHHPAGAAGEDDGAAEQGATGEQADESAEPAEGAEVHDPDDACHLPDSGDWLDNLRRNVYRSVCGSSLWFDHFFGSKRIENERHDTYGWFGSSLSWDRWDGFEPRVRLRAKIAFPRISSRLSAVVGRDDRESFFEDDTREQRAIPDPFLESDEEWLTGLEYRGVHGDKHDLDYGAGVDVGFPMDPYVRVRYRFQDFLTDRWFFRFRVTPFWSNSEKTGGSTRLEIDHAIHDDMMFRLGGSALWSRRSEGVEWNGGPTLYHRLSDRRAVAWRFLAWGESDADVPLEGYGPEVTYRQRVLKEWLYLELEVRVAARREAPEAPREWVPRVGFGFEMRFGEEEN